MVRFSRSRPAGASLFDATFSLSTTNRMIGIPMFPLAVYCLFLAFLNGRRRPAVFSGTADLMFLAVGLSGLFLVGPGRLLLPLNVLTYWGAGAWLLWTAFYLSVVLIIVRKLRWRIVVYNFCDVDPIPRLWTIIQELDTSAARLGNCMALPERGVQFSIEAAPRSRNVVLVATESAQSVDAWRRLEAELDREVQTISVARGPIAWLFLFLAVVLFGVSCWSLSTELPTALEMIREFLE